MANRCLIGAVPGLGRRLRPCSRICVALESLPLSCAGRAFEKINIGDSALGALSSLPGSLIEGGYPPQPAGSVAGCRAPSPAAARSPSGSFLLRGGLNAQQPGVERGGRFSRISGVRTTSVPDAVPRCLQGPARPAAPALHLPDGAFVFSRLPGHLRVCF